MAAPKITHPTGSDAFVAALALLNVPAPWRMSAEEPGEIFAADGTCILQIDPNSYLADEDVAAIGTWVICAVNTCAGFKAELVPNAKT